MLNVVFSNDVNESGTIMMRIAEINGKFYPYRFSLDTGQVTWNNAFGRHTESGVKHVAEPHNTLKSAKKALCVLGV